MPTKPTHEETVQPTPDRPTDHALPERPKRPEASSPAGNEVTNIPYDPYAYPPPPEPLPVDESVTNIPYDPYVYP